MSESGATSGETFTATLSDSTGLLSATGGVSSATAATDADDQRPLADAVNSDLATLTDTDATAGSDTITVNASDSFGNTRHAQTIAVTVNGLPAITAPSAQTVGVGQAAAIPASASRRAAPPAARRSR